MDLQTSTNHFTSATFSGSTTAQALMVCTGEGVAKTVANVRPVTVVAAFDLSHVQGIAVQVLAHHGGTVLIGRDRPDADYLAAAFRRHGCTVDRVDEFAAVWAAQL